VPSALGEGATRSEFAFDTATTPSTAEQVDAIGTAGGGAGSPVLLRASPVGASGTPVDVAWGGVIGGGSATGVCTAPA
jgi:capsule polysaccharide export protein KpsC/LpsZ